MSNIMLNLPIWWQKGNIFINLWCNKHPRILKAIRWLLVALIVFGIICLFKSCFKASAFNGSTYNNLIGSNSTVNNLTSLIPMDKEYNYVVFQNDVDSYYCYYGKDFTFANNKITSNNCKYIRYYRPTNVSSYSYTFGQDNLSLNVNHIVSSNLTFDRSSHNVNFDDRQDTVTILRLVAVFLPIILFANLWGVIKREFV